MNQENKQTLQEKELNSVNGGATSVDLSITCGNCGKNFDGYECARRTVDDGCDEKTECQCPHCKAWN